MLKIQYKPQRTSFYGSPIIDNMMKSRL